MKKFSFKYQKILEYKETIKQTYATEYHFASKKLDLEKNKLYDIENYRRRLNEERNNIVNPVKIKKLKSHHTYLQIVNEDIKKQKVKVESAKKELTNAKNKLIKAETDKRIFEKLKEKEMEQFKYYQNKEEEKLVDRIICFKNYRQR